MNLGMFGRMEQVVVLHPCRFRVATRLAIDVHTRSGDGAVLENVDGGIDVCIAVFAQEEYVKPFPAAVSGCVGQTAYEPCERPQLQSAAQYVGLFCVIAAGFERGELVEGAYNDGTFEAVEFVQFTVLKRNEVK